MVSTARLPWLLDLVRRRSSRHPWSSTSAWTTSWQVSRGNLRLERGMWHRTGCGNSSPNAREKLDANQPPSFAKGRTSSQSSVVKPAIKPFLACGAHVQNPGLGWLVYWKPIGWNMNGFSPLSFWPILSIQSLCSLPCTQSLYSPCQLCVPTPVPSSSAERTPGYTGPLGCCFRIHKNPWWSGYLQKATIYGNIYGSHPGLTLEMWIVSIVSGPTATESSKRPWTSRPVNFQLYKASPAVPASPGTAPVVSHNQRMIWVVMDRNWLCWVILINKNFTIIYIYIDVYIRCETVNWTVEDQNVVKTSTYGHSARHAFLFQELR